MKSTLILALAALSVNTNAKALKARQDPVVFTYNISQDGTCASLPFSPAKEFRRSQIPKNGCVVLSSLAAGNSTPAAPVTAFLFVRAFPPSGVCRLFFYPTANCVSETPTAIGELMCADRRFQSFKLDNCV